MDVPSYPGTVGWQGQWESGTVQWDTWDMSGMSLYSNPRTVDFYCAVGHSGISLVIAGLHVGWEGQWNSCTVQWDTWDMSGLSLVIPGRRVSGIVEWDTGISLVVLGLHVGWEGQWDSGTWDVIPAVYARWKRQWDTRDMSRIQ